MAGNQTIPIAINLIFVQINRKNRYSGVEINKRPMDNIAESI